MSTRVAGSLSECSAHLSVGTSGLLHLRCLQVSKDDQDLMPLLTKGLCMETSKAKHLAINSEMEEPRAIGKVME